MRREHTSFISNPWLSNVRSVSLMQLPVIIADGQSLFCQLRSVWTKYTDRDIRQISDRYQTELSVMNWTEPRDRQSRSQSLVPLDQRSENENSGSNHFEITKEITKFCAGQKDRGLWGQEWGTVHYLSEGGLGEKFQKLLILSRPPSNLAYC